MEHLYNSKEQWKLILYTILIRISYDIMYWFIIQEEFSNIMLLARAYSRGALCFDNDILKYIFSYVVTVLSAILLFKRVIRGDRFSDLMIVSIYYISFLPCLTLYSCSNIRWDALFILSLFWIYFLTIQDFIINRVRLRRTSNIDILEQRINLDIKNKKIIMHIIFVVFICGSIILSYVYNGGFKFNLSLNTEDVYEARLLARDKFGIIVNYFRNTAMYAVLPLLTTYSLFKKKYSMVCLCLFTQVLLFNIDSIKSTLFLTILSIIAYFFVNKKIIVSIAKAIMLINYGSVVTYFFTGGLFLVDNLMKRVYFLPALISNFYYEYVTDNGAMYFASSLLLEFNIISDYIYSQLSLPFSVGLQYFGNAEIRANTGAFGGAYEYGILGIFIIPLVYVCFFCMLNKFTSNINTKVFISVIVVYSYMIANTSITTIFLVYGFIITIYELYLINEISLLERHKNTSNLS